MAQPGGLFNFGSNPQQPATNFGSGAGSAFGSGFSFGQQPQQPGATQQGAPASAPAFSFAGSGTSAQPAGSLFGAPTAAPAFGAQTAAPAFGAQTAAPAFGAQTAAPAFGAQTAAPAFGAAAPQAAGGMFNFGSNQPTATSTANTGTAGFSFGAPTTAAPQAVSAFSFAGNTGAATGGLTYGTPASTNTGLGFGTSAAPSTGLTFGSTAVSAPTAGLTFGAATTNAAPGTGLTFGVPPQANTGLSLGGTTTTASGTGFSFGAPTSSASTTGLFGTPATSTTTATVAPFSFGTKLGTTATTTAPTTSAASGFSFGTPLATATTSALGGFSFGSTNTSAPSGGGLFGTAPAASSAGFSFGAKLPAATTTAGGLSFGGFSGFGTSVAPTAATTTPSTGLGGVPKYASTGAENSFAFGGGSSDGKTENRALQELPLPQEMLILVEELKNQIKVEKLKFTELNRSSNDSLITKVSEEIEEVRGQVTVIANLIQKQASNCEAIRTLVHQGIANAEMANQTRETPLSSQGDHTSPIQYFFRLVDNYRERMHVYLREIEKAESSLSYVLSAQPSFTSKELLDACNVTRNSIIALAAKVQILHEDVVRVIEQHRNLQRYLLGDVTDLNLSTGPKQSAALAKVLNNKDENRFADVNVLFPHKMVEPPKIGALIMSQNPQGKTTPPGITSTPIRNLQHHPMSGHNKTADTFYYPSHALFQTQQSAILSSTQMPPGSHHSPGISLKRSKR